MISQLFKRSQPAPTPQARPDECGVPRCTDLGEAKVFEGFPEVCETHLMVVEFEGWDAPPPQWINSNYRPHCESCGEDH